jgi:acyl-CoA synthetase (AMP-forming)/AMP-acid ligase II
MHYTNYFIETLRNFDEQQILLFEQHKSITSGELLANSQQLANGLQSKGVKRGDRVVLAVKPSIEFLQIIYANMMLRTIMAIIDPEMGRDNYTAKLRQFNPQHAFVDSRLVLLSEHPIAKFIVLKINRSIPPFPLLQKTTIFTTGPRLPIVQGHTPIQKLLKNAELPNDTFKHGADTDDFLVTYTSGTLAQPKGVVHSYGSMANSIRHLSTMLKRHQDAVIATHLPHFALLGISAGVKVHLWDYKASAQQKLDFIENHGITTLFGPPSDYLPLLEQLIKTGKKFPQSLKNIYLGSAPVYNTFLSKLMSCCNQVKVTCLYGMTENLMVTYIDAQEKMNAVVEGDLVGSPFPHVQLSIEQDGEIRIVSDQLYSHYFESEQHDGSHLSGDLGKLDEKGRLILQGRKKDMIIRGNFNIYPGLYEPTINRIEGIIEAVLIGVYNPSKADEEIVLVVEREGNITADAIMSKLKNGHYSIDKDALPDHILFLPLARSGRQNKVNRKEMAATIKKMML